MYTNSHEFTNEILYLFKNEDFRKRIILNAREKSRKNLIGLLSENLTMKLFNKNN